MFLSLIDINRDHNRLLIPMHGNPKYEVNVILLKIKMKVCNDVFETKKFPSFRHICKFEYVINKVI